MNFRLFWMLLLISSCSTINKYGSPEVKTVFKKYEVANREKKIVNVKDFSPICLPDDQTNQEGYIFSTGVVYDREKLLKALYFEKAQLEIKNRIVNSNREIETKAISNEVLDIDTFLCFKRGWSVFEVDGNDFLYVTYRLREK